MKKLNIILCAGLFLALSGCTDASANISDANTTLFKVGNETVTKEDIYTYAKNTLAGDATATLVKASLLDNEVPVTDDMEKEAKKTFDAVKENFGSKFAEMIKSNGYKDEDSYYKEVTLRNIQTQALTKKYLTEEDKMSEYQTIKAQLVIASNEENAKKALSAIQSGTSFEDAAKSYGDTSYSDGSEKVYSSATGLSSTVWQSIINITEGSLSTDVIADTENNLYYIVKVTNTNLDDFKEEAIDALSSLSSVSSTSFIYFLEKHDFKVWDIDAYTQLQTSNPSYLVQDN